MRRRGKRGEEKDGKFPGQPERRVGKGKA